jgi:hypothetical protein
MFGLLPPIPHRATLGVPQLWRPNRPPQLRQGAAPEVKVQTGPKRSHASHGGGWYAVACGVTH